MPIGRPSLRINLQFLLLLTLCGAFYFLGWSTHQGRTEGRYERARFSAKQMQDQWYEESQMIRRATEERSGDGVSIGQAMRMLEAQLEQSNAPASNDAASNDAEEGVSE